MNNPDYISKSLETIFWVKIIKLFVADPGFGMEKFRSGMRDRKSRIRDPGFFLNISVPQHWQQLKRFPLYMAGGTRLTVGFTWRTGWSATGWRTSTTSSTWATAGRTRPRSSAFPGKSTRRKLNFQGLCLSDSYPAFFLLIATTSNKNF